MTRSKTGKQLKKLTAEFVRGKRVLVKVDFNTPLKTIAGKPTVADDTRIRLALPTLEFLRKHNAKIILTSHLGRPDGKPDPRYSLKPVAKQLEKLLGRKVALAPTPAGPQAQELAEKLQPGEILLLENSRFDPGEMTNDSKFAKQLAALADVYVNEGFASSHRAHASVAGVMKLLPSRAGLALAEEVALLQSVMDNPTRPFVTIVGGAKISDKIEAIRNLSNIASVVLVGGGVANNFLKAEGVEVFHSYLEDKPADQKKKGVSFVAVAEQLLENTKSEKMLLHDYIPLPKIIYPSDVVAGDKLDNPTETAVLDLTGGNNHEKKENWMFLDIGPKTRQLYREIILQAKTVFWNGPMGVFEQPEFAGGTAAVAQAIADSKARCVVGGGDTIGAIHTLGFTRHFPKVSAAGGAALEFLGGKKLPGLEPLWEDKP